MPDLLDDARRLDHRTDSILSSFDSRFSSVLARAQTRTTLRLRGALTIEEDGTVRPTARNIRALRQLPKIFRSNLSAEGYDSLVSGFLKSFNGGLPIMDEILEKVSDAYEVETPEFTKQDKEFFEEVKAGTSLNLEANVDFVAQGARASTMFAVGGTPFAELAVELAERLHLALGQANTIAATGISTFYRVVAARGYNQIEDQLSKHDKQLEYTYHGPGDKLTRPFCMRLVEQARGGKTWSKVQIDGMDNDQLPDVFTTCGGYNCRHQWLVALGEATT